MKNAILILWLMAGLTACGGGGSSGGTGNSNPTPTAAVSINCADLTNDVSQSACSGVHSLLAADVSLLTGNLSHLMGPIPDDEPTVYMGEVSLAGVINTDVVIDNPTDTEWHGTIEVTYYMDCGGGEFGAYPATGSGVVVPPHDSLHWGIGMGCNSPNALGDHKSIMTLYESDHTTVRDRIVGSYTVIE